MKRLTLFIMAAALVVAGNALAIAGWDINNPYTVDANTLGLWHFDEQPGGTTAFDETANSNDAVISGLPAAPFGPLDPNNTWAAGKFGNGLNTWYNSTTDRNMGTLTVAQDPAGNNSLDFNLADAFTIEFWMNARAVGSTTSFHYIFTKGTMSEGQVHYNTDGAGVNRIGLTAYAGGWKTVFDNTHIPLNEWHHVGVTGDFDAVNNEHTISFYIDGNLSSTHVLPRISTLSGTDLTLLGNPSALWYRTYLGQLDELRVSDVNRANVIPEPSLALIALGALAFLKRR